jgi:hypothetical protein
MISADGTRRQLLKKGEVKCLQNDRVVLVPGDPKEVALVREMFRMIVEEKSNPFRITRELNDQGKTLRGHRWNRQMVTRILTDPKYAGACVWNRSTRRLGGPNVPVPRSDWIIREGAFEPVVDPAIFADAQRVLGKRICTKSNEEILEMLRQILITTGKLTGAILQKTPGAPSILVCRRRFGTIEKAFEAAGYTRSSVMKKSMVGPHKDE